MAAGSAARNPVPALLAAACLLLLGTAARAQLSATFYASSCPALQSTVRSGVRQALASDGRIAASLLRLFFHDCFVNGCDASVLLADTAGFTGEQGAGPNQNSIRGMGVVDTIKAAVEASCNATVSCADILALAARDSVVLTGGPSWTVQLGRRDARTASQSAANSNLPPPTSSLATLTSSFSAQGLSQRDLVALSGAHTIGFARCTSFRTRIYNDANIDPAFANATAATCPRSGGDGNLAPLDVQTRSTFDNAYYRNVAAQRGLLHSDQELFGGAAMPVVRSYVNNQALFFSDFAAAMVRMGNISPLTGTSGEIRRTCSRVN